jgi:hypothetical protein
MSSRRARGWFRLGWIALALLALLIALTARVAVVHCDATLREVSEPDSWQDWPLSTEAEGFALCPDGSPAAARLIGRADGGRLWIRGRASDRMFVAAAPPRTEEAPHERFVGAFRAELGPRYVFASRAGTFMSLGLLSSLLAVVGGLWVGRARLRPVPAPGASPSLAPYRQGVRAEPAAREGEEAARAEGAIGAVRVALLLGATMFGLGAAAGGWALVREMFRSLP